MFDTVKVRYPLPNPAHQQLVYQTKDLDFMMEQYIILEDGRLVVQRRETEWVDDPEPVEGPAGRLKLFRGHLKTLRSWWELAYHHGDVNIYTSIDAAADGDGSKDEWVEYVVRFTQGRVERVFVLDEVKPREGVVVIEPYWEI